MTPDLPFDPEIRTLTLHGSPVTYTDDGDSAPALVLIHGRPGSVRDFRWLGAALREVRPSTRVVRIDMPGSGGTGQRLGGKMTVESRGRFVAGVLAELDLDRVIIVGHSIGGAPAIAATALAPERVRGLALLASVGLTPHRAYRSLPLPRIVAPVICSSLGRHLFARHLRDAFIRLGFPSSTPTGQLFVTMRTVGALRFPAVREFAGNVADRGIPARVLLARDDPFIEQEIGEGLALELEADLTLFDDGGHNIQKTRAVEIAEALLGLLSSAGTRDPSTSARPRLLAMSGQSSTAVLTPAAPDDAVIPSRS